MSQKIELTGGRNQCQGCKQYFSRTSVFDRHRTGSFGVDRRCMTIDEMSNDGMRLIDGVWRGEAMPEFGRAANV